MPKRKKYQDTIKVVKYKEEGKEVTTVRNVARASDSGPVASGSSASVVEDIPDPVQQVPVDQQSYGQRKTKESLEWELLHPEILKANIEEMCPSTSKCSLCGVFTEQIIFCGDCGPMAFYCKTCCNNIHKVVVFHKPCQWKSSMYVPYLDLQDVFERQDHVNCPSTYTKTISVFSLSGHQHQCTINFCKCEREAVTLNRFKLWPSSPEFPRVAFDIKLLEMARILQVVSHVSLMSFCEAIQESKGFLPVLLKAEEAKDLYRCLVGDSFQEYRYHRSQFVSLQSYDPSVPEVRNECPVCAESEAQNIICLDGNFGLVHKRSSGQGSKEPRRKQFFLDQNFTDAFVENYSHDKSRQISNCSDFQAGNILRSKKKTDKLDITGVFGSVCQHDIPQMFCNMRHGERLAYPVCILNEMSQASHQGDIIVMYDIACSFSRHLQKHNPDLLAGVKLAVPSFHSYAHNVACQLEFGQRFVTDTGLNDGEGTERLWSYLRRFSTITKEMTADNRQDVLVDGLQHFANKLKEKIGERLLGMLKKSQKIQQEAKDGYLAVETKYQGKAEEWLSTWKMQCSKKFKSAENLTPEEKFYWQTRQISKLREIVEITSDEDQQEILENQIMKLQKEVKKVARPENVLDSSSMENLVKRVEDKLKRNQTRNMQNLSSERQYILSLSKKYSVGQEMAKRISKQLSTNSEKLKKALNQYNIEFMEKIQFNEVNTPSANFFKTLNLPRILNEEQVQASEKFSLYHHAVKQEQMTKNEIKVLFQGIESTNHKLYELILEAPEDTRYHKGRKHMLMMFKLKSEKLWSRYFYALSEFTDKPVDYFVHTHISAPEETGQSYPLLDETYFSESDSDSESEI